MPRPKVHQIHQSGGSSWVGLFLVVNLAGFLFIFLFFIFIFYKNIFSFSKFTGIYPGRPAAGRLGPGRPATGRQELFYKKIYEFFCRKAPGGPVARQQGGRPPSSGAAGPGRLAAGRPAPPPLYKGWLVPPLLICITKIPETNKREGGRERGEALPDFRAGDCR